MAIYTMAMLNYQRVHHLLFMVNSPQPSGALNFQVQPTAFPCCVFRGPNCCDVAQLWGWLWSMVGYGGLRWAMVGWVYGGLGT